MLVLYLFLQGWNLHVGLGRSFLVGTHIESIIKLWLLCVDLDSWRCYVILLSRALRRVSALVLDDVLWNKNAASTRAKISICFVHVGVEVLARQLLILWPWVLLLVVPQLLLGSDGLAIGSNRIFRASASSSVVSVFIKLLIAQYLLLLLRDAIDALSELHLLL